MTLADEIARAAVNLARCQVAWMSDPAFEWTRRHQKEWIELGAVARRLLDSRAPPQNIDATGGRMTQEGGLAPGAGNPPGLTMPPLW